MFALQQLRAAVRGRMIQPHDAGYDEARKVFNAMIDRRPAAILCCAGAADVMEGIHFARAHNLELAVRSTGHNVTGASVSDGGLVLDLSAMKGIHVDPAMQTVRVEAGVTWAELNHELQAFGLAATGGYVGTTGVAGLTLGGGLGWMVRKHGCALDNLLSADVVLANGKLVTANRNDNPDLFWGLRGAGPNFGVVTSFEFQAHPAGTVLAGLVLHPPEKAGDALRFWRDYESNAPEEMSNAAVIFTAPRELQLPPELHGRPILGLGGVWTGPLDAGEAALKPLREFGPPAADTYRAIPYSAAQSMADFLWNRGTYNYWKSNFMASVSDEAIQVILHFASRVPSPRTVIILEHDGDSAFSRISDDATAFGNRSFAYNLVVTTVWTEPSHAERNIGWTREFWRAMQPYLAESAYVNYLGDMDEESIRAAYGAKRARLAALKDKYDPANFFHMNQNIKPSPAARDASA